MGRLEPSFLAWYYVLVMWFGELTSQITDVEEDDDHYQSRCWLGLIYCVMMQVRSHVMVDRLQLHQCALPIAFCRIFCNNTGGNNLLLSSIIINPSSCYLSLNPKLIPCSFNRGISSLSCCGAYAQAKVWWLSPKTMWIISQVYCSSIFSSDIYGVNRKHVDECQQRGEANCSDSGPLCVMSRILCIRSFEYSWVTKCTAQDFKQIRYFCSKHTSTLEPLGTIKK